MLIVIVMAVSVLLCILIVATGLACLRRFVLPIVVHWWIHKGGGDGANAPLNSWQQQQIIFLLNIIKK